MARDRVRPGATGGVEPPTTDVSVAQVQARYGLPRRWFVYPSITYPHKNHGLLLRAFAQVAAREHDVVLVLTGGGAGRRRRSPSSSSRLGLAAGSGAPAWCPGATCSPSCAARSP